MPTAEESSIAVLGGTFDPIHLGHLKLAIDIVERLNLQQIRLMPSYQPVHRDSPCATVEQRLAMLELAVDDIPKLTIDERELHRQGPSYTLLSLQEIRAEIGADTPLYFVLGEDAFCQFDQWHKWRELISYAHLLVAIRPGSHQKLSKPLAGFVKKYQYQGKGFPYTAAGTLVSLNNPILEIASTEIRNSIIAGRNIRQLIPAKVCDYIEQQKIYC